MRVKNSSCNVLFIAFNQDSSRISVGTSSGFKTYSCEPFKVLYDKQSEGTSIVEMLFNSSLVAQVGSGDRAETTQRVLRMYNTKREKEIIRMNYNTAVLAVKLNRKRLVVLLEKAIYIYDITNMHLVHTIQSTPSNPKGICALAHCNGGEQGAGAGAAAAAAAAAAEDNMNYFMAYPGEALGEVAVFDTVNLRNISSVRAHNSSVSCLELSNDGEKLCTASEKGTVIRVFNTKSGEKLFEFRRGMKSYATIYSMSFNKSSTALCVSSDKATIHIFKLEQAPPAAVEGWGSYLLGATSSYLPTAVSDIWSQSRSFAQVTLPNPGVENVCALVGEGKSSKVLVLSADGYFYKFEVDLEKGGEFSANTKRELLPSGDGAGAAGAGGAAGAAATGGSAGAGSADAADFE